MHICIELCFLLIIKVFTVEKNIIQIFKNEYQTITFYQITIAELNI